MKGGRIVAEVRAAAEIELRYLERMIARSSENVGRWRLARELTLKGLIAFQLKTWDKKRG